MSELLSRITQILDTLAVGERTTVRDIAAKAELPKTTVHRMLQDLVELRLVEIGDRSGHYQLGPRLLELGVAYQYQHRGDLVQVAAGPMTRLRDRTGETVGLTVLGANEDEVVHVLEIRGASELSLSFQTGTPVPLWVGAPSRLFLTQFDPDRAREAVVDRATPKIPPHSPLDPDEVIERVESARIAGYAIASNENVAGVNTLSVPVSDISGGIIATISLTAPSRQMPKSKMMKYLPWAQEAAHEVSRVIELRADF